MGDWPTTGSGSKRARSELIGVTREWDGTDFFALTGCGKGPLSRAVHLGERDAAPTQGAQLKAPTDLELSGRSPGSISRFLSPIPPLSIT